jgi:uncharacterized protein YjiS (DUF1127 family)
MYNTLTFEDSTTCGSRSKLWPKVAGRQEEKTFLTRVFDVLGEWQDRSAGRRRLASLDSRMLSDVGIDRAAAYAESAKSFWQS